VSNFDLEVSGQVVFFEFKEVLYVFGDNDFYSCAIKVALGLIAGAVVELGIVFEH